MHRRDAEAPREDRITEKIIGAAIEIHRVLGPGLLESAYEECLCYELSQRDLQFKRQVPLPVTYKGIKLACGYKMDLLVDDLVIVELKTVESLLASSLGSAAELFAALRKAGRPADKLSTPVLKSGLKRIVNHFSETSASRRLGVEKMDSRRCSALS